MKRLLYILLLCPAIIRAQSIAITTPADTVCAGTPVTFTAIASGISSPHYQWEINSTNAGTDSAGFTTTLNDWDIVECLLMNSSRDTVFATSNSIGMTVRPLPDAYFGLKDAATKLCLGKSIDLWRSDFSGLVHSKHGLVRINLYPPMSVTGLAAGMDTLYNIEYNECGTDVHYLPIEVRGLPPTPSPIIAPSTDICVGESIPLTDTSTNLGLWHWAVTNNNLKLNASNGSITGLNPGQDTAIFVVNNGCGNSSASIAITINPPGKILGPDTLCKDQSTTLSNDYPGGTWSSSNPAIATISQDGQMTCLAADTVYISYALGSCTVTKKAVVNPLPLLSGNRGICPNEETTLTASLPGKKWSSANTDAATIDSFGNIKGMNHGSSLISFTAINGCSSSIELTVNLLPATITGDPGICLKRGSYLYNDVPGGKWSSDRPYTASIDSLSGFISGISNGIANITYTLPTGCNITRQVIAAYCYEEQCIFPNPASHEITIEADTAIYFEYAIINYMGQMITRAPLTETFTTLDIRTFPRGFYFIYLWGRVYLHGDHRMHIERFIKQ